MPRTEKRARAREDREERGAIESGSSVSHIFRMDILFFPVASAPVSPPRCVDTRRVRFTSEREYIYVFKIRKEGRKEGRKGRCEISARVRTFRWTRAKKDRLRFACIKSIQAVVCARVNLW